MRPLAISLRQTIKNYRRRIIAWFTIAAIKKSAKQVNDGSDVRATKRVKKLATVNLIGRPLGK